MLDLIGRRYLIVSVAEKKRYPTPEQWVTYCDVVGNLLTHTAEDFVLVQRLEAAVRAAAQSVPELKLLPPLAIDELRPFVTQVEQALGAGGVDSRRRTAILNIVKDWVFEGLDVSDLRPNAALLVDGLAKALKLNGKT